MSRVIIMGDLHIGAKQGSISVADLQIKFLKEVIAEAVKLGIDTIVQVGDIFDHQTHTKHVVFDHWKREFFQPMKAAGIKMITLVGNHDTPFKNTILVNSSRLFLGGYDNIQVIDEPGDVSILGYNCLILPWICADNYARSIECIQTSTSEIAFGHLDLTGFEMYKGNVNTGGMDPAVFKRFGKVFSGHFHTVSSKGNVMYVGSPFELTWADCDDPRGVFIYDFKTKQVEPIQNTNKVFYRIEYDDSVDFDDDQDFIDSLLDDKELADKYVRLVVVNKKNPTIFDSVVDAINNKNPFDFKIVELTSDYSADSVELSDDITDVADTMQTISGYVDGVDDDNLDKDKLKVYFKSLYISALEKE